MLIRALSKEVVEEEEVAKSSGDRPSSSDSLK
jgi:hypothetical protein